MYRIAILTASDQGAAGLREDRSGPVIAAALALVGEIAATAIVADDRATIAEQLRQWTDSDGIDLVLTTGGTGLSPRDITPEATLDVVERLVPGIPEAMRAYSLTLTNRAMLSRAVAGTRGRTLIINLPGSPRAVSECLEVIVPVLPHALGILTAREGECARP
ncbi:MAG: MogA/MoaB family molybdenum cofactor biosynthesis protein [Clostridia bacterium]|nr:MogA/MoaB family molybdenum cofactor biosynthesis protein [Clostridia bacterium]NCC77187.1 MogA/MoaB family molybdenum cofactor biosynthesis protein [Clostridia bacterium]